MAAATIHDDQGNAVHIGGEGECNVNDYLSVMKTLCICLYRRTVETETMMNSFVYILE